MTNCMIEFGSKAHGKCAVRHMGSTQPARSCLRISLNPIILK